jgi:phage head maturation protease
MFEEKMSRGTWRRGLSQGPDTVLLQDHSGLGLARTKTPSGDPSLLLSEPDRGLFCEAFLDASAPRVQDLRSTAENCGLQMSVGMRVSGDRWNEDRSRREVKEASVHKGDVTVCNFGANDAAAATISARGAAGEKERRAYAESLKGGTERRMCPVDDYELRETATMTVAQAPPIRSYVQIARNHAAGGHAKTPRGRSQIRVPRYLEIAKARRAAAGSATRPRGKRAALVLSPFGPDWAISVGGVHKAILQVEVGHARGPAEDAIKAWVWKRANELGQGASVPADWKNSALLAAYIEENDPATATESVGGQEQ